MKSVRGSELDIGLCKSPFALIMEVDLVERDKMYNIIRNKICRGPLINVDMIVVIGCVRIAPISKLSDLSVERYEGFDYVIKSDYGGWGIGDPFDPSKGEIRGATEEQVREICTDPNNILIHRCISAKSEKGRYLMEKYFTDQV